MILWFEKYLGSSVILTSVGRFGSGRERAFAAINSSNIPWTSSSSKGYFFSFLSWRVSRRAPSFCLPLLLLKFPPLVGFGLALTNATIDPPFLFGLLISSLLGFMAFWWASCLSTLFSLDTRASKFWGSAVPTYVAIWGSKLFAHIWTADCSLSFSGHCKLKLLHLMMKSLTLSFGLWWVSARSIIETLRFELTNWARNALWRSSQVCDDPGWSWVCHAKAAPLKDCTNCLISNASFKAVSPHAE